MLLKNWKGYIKKEVEKIWVEKIKKYSIALKESGDYKDFETRLCFDVYWAIPQERTDFLSEFGKAKKELNANDNHLKTLMKKVLKDFNIL